MYFFRVSSKNKKKEKNNIDGENRKLEMDGTENN